jgi:hypothetical protein
MTTLAQIRDELPSQQLLQIHHSWIAEEIGRLPAPLQGVSCASLPDAVRDKTRALLPKVTAGKPSPAIAPLLQTELWNRLRSPAYRPSWQLPESPLRKLLTLSKAQLVRYVDLLALWELAPELQKLIDKEKLQQVRGLLSAEQQGYLETALRMQAAPSAIKKPILQLIDQADRFRRALHEKGLARLASAFKAADSPIVWNLSRRLDTGRGRYLESAYTRLAGGAAPAKMVEQMVTLIDRVSA